MFNDGFLMKIDNDLVKHCHSLKFQLEIIQTAHFHSEQSVLSVGNTTAMNTWMTQPYTLYITLVKGIYRHT